MERERITQREAAETLPLITEGAEVVDVEAMDHNRRDEIETEVRETLRRHDAEELLARAATANDEDVDWERFREAWDEGDPPRVLEKKFSTLRQRSKRAYPSLLKIRFDEDETDIDFAPGQYVTVRYGGVPRPYSIASSPNDDALEICVRRVPGGKLTTQLCSEAEVGDDVTLRGPNGEFTLQEPSGRDVVFLATGTGVAPFRSMIEYTFEEGRDEYGGEQRDVWLFLGTGWRDDLAYREEFRALDDEHDNFHFVPTLSREEYLTDWAGETAYVQQTLLKYVVDDALADVDLTDAVERIAGEDPNYDIDARIDPANAEVYACGTNVMVEGLTSVVRRLGVPDDYLESEGFG